MSDYEESLKKIAAQFDYRIRTYGDSPESAEHSNLASQELRMQIVCEIADLKNAKVLDFGCATGHLLTFLRENYAFEGEYVGYDLSEEMIGVASEKFSDARFEVRNILTYGVTESFDYVMVLSLIHI